MIAIEALVLGKSVDFSHLQVSQEQVEFVVGPTISNKVDLVEVVSKCVPGEQHPHLITLDHKAAGFFILDKSYGEDFEFCPPDGLGLRKFFIDMRLQGQGIAREVLRQLPSWVEANFKGYRAVYLTVNSRNIRGYQCYVKYGFTDTGEKYMEGPVGPQYIMKMDLDSQQM